MARIFISGNTPSSKNSRVLSFGKKKSFPSKAAQKWWNITGVEFMAQRRQFLDSLVGLKIPYYIEFTFVRKTRGIFDYINALQIVADAMTAHGWIHDDNVEFIKPYFGDAQYDKFNPGVYIEVLREKPKHKLPALHIRTLLVKARDEYRDSNLEIGEATLKEIFDLLTSKQSL